MAYRRTRHILAALSVAALGCDRPKVPPPADSSVARGGRGPDSASVAPVLTWDPSAGLVLLVAGDAPTQAIVLTPDSANAALQLAAVPQPASVTLLGRGGMVQVAELQAASDSDTCRPWPLSAAPPPRPWSVGFVGGVVSPQPMDSIEALGRADSTALTAAVTRLASALPNDSAGRFAGLPFITRTLWRFTVASGRQVVVATLMRQINQEATPLQERTLLFAERDTTADAAFSIAYYERSYGNEDSIETRDVLAAALLGESRRPTVVVSRDFGDAQSFSFIERGDDGRWRSRWTSGRRRC